MLIESDPKPDNNFIKLNYPERKCNNPFKIQSMAVNFPTGKDDPIKAFLNSGEAFEDVDNLKGFLHKLTYIIFILNSKEEVVFSNQNLLKKFNIDIPNKPKGNNPGEIFGCVNQPKGKLGCGSSKLCKYCTVVNSILEVRNINAPFIREASISIDNKGIEEQLDLEISATPFKFAGKMYTVFSARDITDKKRKEILERTFFHDIINMAGSLDGMMELMEELKDNDRDKLMASAKRLSNSLIDEIMSQYQISKAELNELTVSWENLELNTLVEESIDNIRHHHVSSQKHIVYSGLKEKQYALTDKVLFNRIVVNMIKNALEASNLGETVTVKLVKNKDLFEVQVHNSKFIHSNIQSQIFQRSFSTKGSGRGIGTYSMKMLGERYLRGKVSFQSSLESGTIFSFSFREEPQ